MKNLRLVLETQRRNFRLRLWPETVLDPLDDAARIVEQFDEQRAAIEANTHLTAEGKAAARAKARDVALDAIAKWHAPRLAGLDADLGLHRAKLLPATTPPDARRVDAMAAQLQRFTPEERAVLYGSATDEERIAMEAASASVGRLPSKSSNGLEWTPLLDSATVDEAVLARATAKNPEAAQRYQELAEIRALHVTVAGLAAAEVREAVQS